MNEFLLQFHFLRPLWLLALVPVIVFCFLLLRHQKTANQWSRYINPALLTHLLDKKHIQQKRWPLWGALSLWLLTCFALAGPTWKQLPQPVEQTTEALVLCWDLSPSMLAQDVKPSRINRARLKIIDLLKSRNEGLYALVAYSGEAYTVTPLTDDIQTIINSLPALSPAHLPTVGSNPEMALDNAQKLLKDSGASAGNIVFITDGIDQNADEYIIDQAKQSPYKITFWPVGTTEGAPIPLPSGGFAKDASGNMVIPKLDEAALQKLASKAGAYYVPMLTNDDDIKTLNQLLKPSNAQTAKTERNFDQWFEHGQYFALFLLPFVALLFRSGWIFCLILCTAVIYSPSSHASAWDDLWKTQDQQAAEKLNAGDPEAAKLFSTPDRRGSVLYQQQEYEQAASEFNKAEGATSAFNQGTALTQTGKFEEAVKAFDDALKQNPDFEAAKKNKAIAQQLADLQKQQQEQQQNQQGDDSKNSDEQDSQDGDQSKSEGQQNSQNQNGQQQDNNQQADNSQNDQNESGDPSDPKQGQQDDQQQDGQQKNNQQQDAQQQSDQQQAEQQAQQKDEPAADDNPYAGVSPEEAKEQQDEQRQAAQAEESEETDQDQKQQQQQATALTGAPTGEKSEEEQQLELMLRKVPDDPGGLLREKFRYQYLQRKQDPTQSFSKNEAETRW